MSNWNTLQDQVSAWALRNFGSVEPWQPYVGLIEEIGEFFAASSIADREDALGDQAIYAVNLADKVGFRMIDIAADPANFPRRYRPKEVIGAIALAGRAILKHHQGIRSVDLAMRKEMVYVGLSIWFRWATWKLPRAASPKHATVFAVAWTTWEEVRKRNWVDHPADANIIAKEVRDVRD